MAILTLKDDNESVDFMADPNYKLIDDTFRMSTPEKVEQRIQDNFFAGRNLQSMEYGPRQITFDVMVLGLTVKELSENVSKIQRILSRASSLTYLSGGAYRQNVTYAEGADTGDHGVILQMKRGSDSWGEVTSESTRANVAMSGLFTLRIVSGDLEVIENLFASSQKTGTNRRLGNPGSYTYHEQYYRTCTITLTCEPFILGPSRIIGSRSAPGFRIEAVNSQTDVNRMFISASSVPGDVEALTRISTQVATSTGLIIARDAGISVLNCPGYPTLTGGTKDDMFVYGQILSESNKNLIIQINGVGTPNTFRFSNDDGASWGPTTNLVAHTPIQLVAGGSAAQNAYAVFGSTTGFTNAQTWTFTPHQAFFPSGVANAFSTNKTAFLSDVGHPIHTFRVNVPPGCRGRYKVSGYITTSPECEYRMRVSFIGRDASGARLSTSEQYFEWTGPYASRLIDFGVIDLTSISAPFLSHPMSSCVLRISIYARTVEDINTGSHGSIQFVRGWLIPAQDDFAHMHAAWVTDGGGHEVYCNYDPSNPYIAEENANAYDVSGLTGKVVVGLDGTYGGNIITLIPNIDQTLLFVPLFSVSADWRSASVNADSETGNTYVAIRPRYLHLPG